MPLTAQERFALGRKKRKQLPRADHAGFNLAGRKEDPLKLLQAAEKGRVPDLVKLKHERMACSPFGYFRGAVPVMAYDLSVSRNTGIHTQLCGDAHVRNLGAFAGPDGRLVFDINDFDETIAGPFEWDVKRMATSLILAGREAGGKESHCREAASTFVERYVAMMRAFWKMPVLDVAKYQVHRLQNVAPVEQILALAQRATPLSSLNALTEIVATRQAAKQAARKPPLAPGHARKHHAAALDPAPPAVASGRIFRTNKPVLERMTGAAAQHVIAAMVPYAETLQVERRRFLDQYRVIDVAFKVVGTGSVGLRDYCLYMEGNGPKDPLFLQIKEEAHSAYAPYLAGPIPAHQGRRVVDGERSMQIQSDPFLGWTTIQGRDYLVRQLNDHKASIDLADLKAAGLMEYAGVCGEMLARGHARGGDCAMLAGYIGGSGRFEEAVVGFAAAYADQTEKDWKALVKSMKK
ncbi:DUF2252 domain-containing protein [Granulicella arctica]|uniref:DUF2252 domain-containing protein n=1 Tax=Granulicella arctica TaxID=940613 RepID=UPI0021E07DC8|nr:DUF2252 domain-containing protein [Granulicella arctica]